MTRASWFLLLLVVGCNAGSDLTVGPPSPDDDAAGGKADGASSGKAELKVTVDARDIRRARYRIGLFNAQSQERRIWFYDTHALDLYATGVILRAREIDGDDDDSTVKLRPFELGDLSPAFKANDDVKCEIDRDLDSAASACSLKSDLDEGAIAGVGRREHQIRTLFDTAQEAMFAAYGPGMTMAALERLGPLDARVWEIETDEVRDEVTAELWYMPDGPQVLELSVKVKEAEADDALAELVDFVESRGLRLATDQISKTQRALEALATAGSL